MATVREWPMSQLASPPEGTENLVAELRQLRHGPFSDRKSTRLNSSHANISYAVFCLKKKKRAVITFRHISRHRPTQPHPQNRVERSKPCCNTVLSQRDDDHPRHSSSDNTHPSLSSLR